VNKKVLTICLVPFIVVLALVLVAFIFSSDDASDDEYVVPAISLGGDFVAAYTPSVTPDDEQFCERTVDGVYITTNDTPPVIYGTGDIVTAVGEPILFRSGVSAADAFGRVLTFTVDSSAVNMNASGVYTAVYAATDAWGLTTEVEINVHVMNITPNAVYEMADAILAQILTTGMTQVQQARAVFDWVSDNITFAMAIGYESVYVAAHQGLINRRGNCFVFYALSEIMLTRAGVPNMRIERIPGTGIGHRWNIINPDELGWHHFDATPNRIISRNERFMFTNAQAIAFTQRIVDEQEDGTVEFYTFNPNLYPDIR